MPDMVARTLALLALAGGATLLGACAQQQATPAAPLGTCAAEPAQFALGYHSTDALQAEVLRRSGARTIRVIRPGDAVTMDFSTERVNMELDAGNRVVRVRCG